MVTRCVPLPPRRWRRSRWSRNCTAAIWPSSASPPNVWRRRSRHRIAWAIPASWWIYWDVGNTIARKAAPSNPYRAWIDTYSDAGFGEAVRAVIAATDRAADGTTEAIRRRMMNAFVRSTQYEWLFWDSAYQQRGWPKVE